MMMLPSDLPGKLRLVIKCPGWPCQWPREGSNADLRHAVRFVPWWFAPLLPAGWKSGWSASVCDRALFEVAKFPNGGLSGSTSAR